LALMYAARAMCDDVFSMGAIYPGFFLAQGATICLQERRGKG
jgi:hypothetical protein